MKLVLIGKHIHSKVWENNKLDIPLFERLGNASDKLLIISQGEVKKRTVVNHNNIKLILLPKKPMLNLLFFICYSIKEVSLTHKTVNWDLLSASEPFGGGVASWFLNWSQKIPYVAMVQGDLLDLPASHFSFLKRSISKHLTLFITRRAQLIRVVSKKIQFSLEAEGIPSDKIFILRNRVDLNRFNSKLLIAKRKKQRQKLKWINKKVFVYTGALTLEKGANEFIHACLELLPLYKDLRILIIGEGLLRNWCEKVLEPYSNKVYFTGFVPHDQVQEWLSIGDIYAFCSHHEGMPRVVLEYMAMGKPIITTAVGGIAEVIEDGINGLLIKTADVSDLIVKTKVILENNIQSKVYGKNARKTVENFHDMEQTINHQISVYKKLANGTIYLKQIKQ